MTVVLKSPLPGNLDSMPATGRPADSDTARITHRMPEGRVSIPPNPVTTAIMLLGLLPDSLFQLLEQLIKLKAVKQTLPLSVTEYLVQGVVQPLLYLVCNLRRDFNPAEILLESNVIVVKVSLIFNQYGSGQKVEFIQVGDVTPGQRFHQGHPLGNGDRHLPFPEDIEKLSKHTYPRRRK